MPTKRVTIIPRIHGKITNDGKISEPDIQSIMEKWLERHPEFKSRTKDMAAFRGQRHTREGYRTEVVSVSIVAGEDIAGYDPAQDVDLYEYYLADEWQDEG
jgi:hypothetical protein